MSTEINKTIIHRLILEVWSQGDMALLAEIVAPDFLDHTTTGDVSGSENFKNLVVAFRTAFPDIKLSINDMIAEGDKVMARWAALGTHKGEFLGNAASDNHISITGVHIYRLTNEKLVERWGNWDQLGLMQQIGIIPTPEE
ncbi:MAG: ester cyclase [Desulfobacteraceae bacterium]|jgi:steroid delta-isomerase-like uncharacterized protein